MSGSTLWVHTIFIKGRITLVEKIKKLLLSQTIKDTAISFIGLGVTAVIGFIYTVILARILGPEQFGVFSAVIALVAIVS